MEKRGNIMLAIVLLIVIAPVSVGLRTTRANSGIPERYITPPSFDFENIMADVLWLRVIQLLGTIYLDQGSLTSQEDIDKIYSIFSRIITLKPQFTPAYEYGGLALSVPAPELSLSILERGISNSPESEWKLLFYAGMVARHWMNDPVKAHSYSKKLQAFPDRPAYVDRFFARTASQAGDLETALDFWKAIHKNAKSHLEKEIAARGLNTAADKILEDSLDELLRQEAKWVKDSI